MKIIVFGGSGFLGSHVADALTNAGHNVWIFDRRRSPYLNEKQEMIVGDILDEKAVREAVKNCDAVYNFAAVADLDEAKERPLDTVKINILGNTIILDASREHKIKRVVFASSLYVYSDVGSFYRSSKRACELIIEDYQKIYGVNYTILRYGSLYGPRADEKNGLFRMVKQAVIEGKITRHGDGEEIREYIHVMDAARMSVEILDKRYENEYVIITGYQQMKIKDLLEMIKEIMGNSIEIEYRPLNNGHCPYDPALHYEITPYSFNPRKAKRLISTLYFDMGQGILECINEIYHKTAGLRLKKEVEEAIKRLEKDAILSIMEGRKIRQGKRLQRFKG
jgi:UDP-glucose 4-epimerase